MSMHFKRLPILKLFAPFILPKDLKANAAKQWKYSKEMALRRLENSNDRHDFFSHLLDDKSHDVSLSHLVGEANDFVLAGSETTATFLAATTYYLLKNPQALQRLKDEVRSNFKSADEIKADSTQHLRYLFAVIEEGLRIFSPAPGGFPRVNPGAEVDGHFVAEGVRITKVISRRVLTLSNI